MIRKSLYICISLLFLHTHVSAQKDSADVPVKRIDHMLDFARQHQGKPYRYGAQGPNSFDCSGFTRYCYKQLGIELKRQSGQQAQQGKKISRSRLKEGDLVFFRETKGRKIGHVGIVSKKKPGKHFEFIHASTSSGIVIEKSNTKYFDKRYKTARRITSDRELKKDEKQKKKNDKRLRARR